MSSRPLFDLLREDSPERRRRAEAPAPARPEHVEPKPFRADSSTRPLPAASPSASDGSPAIGAASWRPAAAIVGIGLLVVVGVMVWSMAHRRGYEAASRELAERALGVHEPSTGVGERTPDGGAAVSPLPYGPSASDNNKSPTYGNGTASDGDVLTATGSRVGDPRQPGLNYLVVATYLPREDAAELVAFLAKGGFPTIGVPIRLDAKEAAKIESRGGVDKNPRSYKVVSLTGVTKDQYAAKGAARTRQEAEVTRLGLAWRGVRVGNSNLARMYWELLAP